MATSGCSPVATDGSVTSVRPSCLLLRRGCAYVVAPLERILFHSRLLQAAPVSGRARAGGSTKQKEGGSSAAQAGEHEPRAAWYADPTRSRGAARAQAQRCLSISGAASITVHFLWSGQAPAAVAAAEPKKRTKIKKRNKPKRKRLIALSCPQERWYRKRGEREGREKDETRNRRRIASEANGFLGPASTKRGGGASCRSL